MKRLFAVLLVILVLSGCKASEGQSAVEPPVQEVNAPSVIPLPVTEKAIRAVYEVDGFQVWEISPYGSDFLVYGGYGAESCQFDWIYGGTGLRCPLTFCTRNVLSYEITDVGQIEVLLGTDNPINASKAFPFRRTAYAALRLDAAGAAEPVEYQVGNEVDSVYWAPRGESYTIGWPHGPAALVDVRVGIGGIEAVFGPTEANIGDFFAAASSIPLTEISFAEDTCFLTFQDTALTSGELISYEDPQVQGRHDQYVQAYGLPTSFTAGVLADSNDFISQVEVRQEGNAVQVVMTLTELAQAYTAEVDQLLRDESRPYLRLIFQESH